MEITEQKHSDINTKLIFISFVILGQTSKLQVFLGGWLKDCTGERDGRNHVIAIFLNFKTTVSILCKDTWALNMSDMD